MWPESLNDGSGYEIELKITSSFDDLVPLVYSSSGFCLWICNAPLYSRSDQFIDLSIITVFLGTI